MTSGLKIGKHREVKPPVGSHTASGWSGEDLGLVGLHGGASRSPKLSERMSPLSPGNAIQARGEASRETESWEAAP